MNLLIGIAEILEKIQVKGLVWTNLPKISASMGIIWEGWSYDRFQIMSKNASATMLVH